MISEAVPFPASVASMITFIIPAHNEELLIGATIKALHTGGAVLNEPYEIIVVDDASTDATTTVAASRGARVLSVQYRQIAAARNAGVAQAQGDLLAFVDADTHVTPAVVLAAVNAMRDGAVGGGSRARFDGPVPIYGRTLAWLWLWLQRLGSLASGCFLFCTRSAFDAVGGFDETLYAAEDLALSRQLKRLGRFVILQETVVTSGRNIRSHSSSEILSIVIGFAVRGNEYFRTRHGPWYGRRN
jgi:glycosyltransferase involved in cell wall biosynthesis